VGDLLAGGGGEGDVFLEQRECPIRKREKENLALGVKE